LKQVKENTVATECHTVLVFKHHVHIFQHCVHFKYSDNNPVTVYSDNL